MAQSTKNPGDRYTDEALDPYQHEADAIFNRPDMQALNDQGDAIARDHDGANDSEKEPTDRQQRREDAAESRRAAERQEQQAAENQFGYRSGNQQKPGGWRSKIMQKRNMVAGGIGGGIIGIVVAIFGILSPLKIPGLIQMVTDEAGQRVEQITTHRAKVIIARYIYSQVGIPGDPVITGKGPVASLIATLRTNHFEKTLAQKGLTFEKNGTDGVKLKFNGNDMGVFKNPETIEAALDADKLTSKMMNDIVKENIPSWRWMKRAKFAKWLRLRYNIKRFGIQKSDEKDKEKKVQDMEQARIEDSYARSTDNAMEALDCLSGADCPIPGENGQNTELADADSTKAEVKQTLDEAAQAAAKDAGAEAAGKATKAAEKLSTRIVAKAVDVVDIVGWIDLAATINHVEREALKAADDDYIVQVPAMIKETAYAQIAGDWMGYSDQIKAGDMDPDYIGVLSDQLSGSEESRAFACISDNSGPGTLLSAITPSVSAAAGCENSGVPVKERIDANNPSALKQTLNKANDILGFNAPEALQYTPSSLALEGVYRVSNKLTDILGAILSFPLKLELSITNSILGSITGTNPNDVIKKWLGDVMTKMMSSILSILGLNIDPMDKGADLLNDIHAGTTVSFNEYCKELGCRKLTPQQASVENQSIAQERAQSVSQQGWLYAMFSPDATYSLTNQLAVALPSSSQITSDGIGELAGVLLSAPARLAGSLSGKANAAGGSYVDLYGIDPEGATAADLNQPVAKEAITGANCPVVADGEYNNCNIDKTVSSAMLCTFTPGDPNCNFISDNTQAATGGSTGTPGAPGTSQMGDDYASECGQYSSFPVSCDGQCVSFVEFRLAKHVSTAKHVPGAGGADIAPNLAQQGFTVDHTPAVHAVVSWPRGGVPGSPANSDFGHTAMVAQVNSSGSIVVEEYNYTNSYGYDTRTIPASAAKLLTYAHVEGDYK